MTSSEKVAYLKGLMDGMELNTEAGEGRLLKLIAEILGELASSVEDLENDLGDLSEDVDTISDDLSDVEDILRESGLDDADEDTDGPEDEEPQFFRINCPSCGKAITVDEDVLELGSIQCPSCGEMMEFDLENLEIAESEEEES